MALDTDEWSVPCPGHSSPSSRSPLAIEYNPRCTPEPGWTLQSREKYFPYWESKHNSSVVQALVSVSISLPRLPSTYTSLQSSIKPLSFKYFAVFFLGVPEN